jgi:Ni,Fe-hydrogenase III component G
MTIEAKKLQHTIYPMHYVDAQSVRPELHASLEQMYLKNPALRFYESDFRNVPKEISPDEVNDAPAREVVDVNVMNGNDYMGRFGYKGVRTTDGTNKLIYEICSNRINKERSPHDKIRTNNQAKAIREALKLFEAKTDEELASSIGEHSIHLFDGMKGSTSFHYVLSGRTEQDAVMYFYKMLFSEDKPTDIPSKVKDVFNEKFVEKLENSIVIDALASDFSKRRATALHVYHDGTARSVNLSDNKVTTYKHTSEMPSWIQDKYFVLKLLGGNQAIKNVGCKFNLFTQIRGYSEDVEPVEAYLVTNGEMTHLM